MRDHPELQANIAYESSPKINWNAFGYYSALEKIGTYIKRHPEMSLTLTQAAAIAGMEPTHFSKFFHKKTGVCFKYWEDLRRVEHAISLFETTDISVTEAALKAGFNDLTTFERTFKRIKRITPRAYKKRCAA